MFFISGVSVWGGISTRKEWFVKHFAVAHQQKDTVSIFFALNIFSHSLPHTCSRWRCAFFWQQSTIFTGFKLGLADFPCFFFSSPFCVMFGRQKKICWKIVATFLDGIWDQWSSHHVNFTHPSDQQFRSGLRNQSPNGSHYPSIFSVEVEIWKHQVSVFIFFLPSIQMSWILAVKKPAGSSMGSMNILSYA